jgi:hypothetical protein
MLFRRTARGETRPLRPYAFRLADSWLIGVAADPAVGSPCSSCVERWLAMRGIAAESTPLQEVPQARDAIAERLLEGTPHTVAEIARDGSVVLLEGVVFPHPACVCAGREYVAPDKWNKKTNFAFSPIYSLRIGRYGTADGNLWLARAEGDGPDGRPFTVVSGGREREGARFSAVEKWLGRYAAVEAQKTGRVLRSHPVVGGETRLGPSTTAFSGVGVGADWQSAALQALYDRTRRAVLRRHATSGKAPMLVVGTGNWLRSKVPFYLLQRYDVHLLFYPNSHPAWVVGAVALCRKGLAENPTFAFGCAGSVHDAIEQTLVTLVERTRPNDPFADGTAAFGRSDGKVEPVEEAQLRRNVRRIHWWNHWIYRCPKISQSDLLHLEPYAPALEPWREYFRDGMAGLELCELNSAVLPAGIRTVVGVGCDPVGTSQMATPIFGVGNWSALALGETAIDGASLF